MTTRAFGSAVAQEAAALIQGGKDPNQTADILCRKDPHGRNYGIGILLDGEGRPMSTSPTLLRAAAEEIKNSTQGFYMNSSARMPALTEAVLRWQRIPETYWGGFRLLLPSDAGTGAIQTGVSVLAGFDPRIHTVGLESWGWPAYRAIAATARLKSKEFSTETPIQEDGVLPVYQAGPMNTTGAVPTAERVQERAAVAASSGTAVLLDRAYSGFEFASRLAEDGYDAVMRASCEQQITPFLEAGVTVALAVSPTKALRTFALRPCGFLLVFSKDDAARNRLGALCGAAIRARGSSFEHPITRALVKAFLSDLPALESEHAEALARTAHAEAGWRRLTADTRIAHLFSDDYAGLFRNITALPGAAEHLYEEHVYPVFSGDRCRLNVTGLPDDPALARAHVALFAAHCG